VRANAEPSLVGVHIPSYKNLVDVWLPWSSGLALVGANGAGKTNLLEALALLMGTEETLRLCKPRLEEGSAAGLSVVVGGDAEALPVGPATLIDLDLGGLGDRGDQLSRDMAWWRTEGVREGDSFAEAVASWDVAEGLKQDCLVAARSPIVQYTLVGLRHRVPGEPFWSCPDCNPDGEPGVVENGNCEICGGRAERHETTQLREERLYRRTLLTDQKLSLSVEPPPSTAFVPLGTTAPGAPGLTAVLELPLTTRPPAVLQWLPRTRTEDEVAESLDGAFAQAEEPVVAFLAGLGERMPSDTVPNSGDANWWLHKVGEAAGNRELRRTDPALFLESEGSHAADWFLGVRQRDGKNVHLGHTHERPMENFSAGQRRWMDEALATVSRELRARGERVELFTSVLDQVDDDNLVEHLVPGTELAESEGYWLGEALDATYSSLEPVLVEIASARDPKEPARHAFVRAVLPYFAQLDQQLVVRVFDEPEAHLHVTAQRRVASAVQSLRHEGQNIVVATHSPAFLEFADWQTVHLSGGALTAVTPMNLKARRRATRELGLTHGELLSAVAGILVVEGPHDQMVLDALYGPDLRQAGIAMVRMFGTDNLPALLSLDFIERYVDAPITVMLDYTVTERVETGRPRTDEERKLVDLRRAAKKRSLSFATLGLRSPDIVCYLSEHAIREKAPDFPGWRPVLQKFERIRIRPSFKPWLLKDFGVDLTDGRRIREVLDVMAANRLPPGPELRQKVSGLLATATDLDWGGASRD
jgi:energy-coupling factor transporter ATP-binding protein EcfA2